MPDKAEVYLFRLAGVRGADLRARGKWKGSIPKALE